jgi:hypothetical protein
VTVLPALIRRDIEYLFFQDAIPWWKVPREIGDEIHKVEDDKNGSIEPYLILIPHIERRYEVTPNTL